MAASRPTLKDNFVQTDDGAQWHRQTLQLWTEDVRAQVGEFLAEKFPNHDLSRVADSLMHRLARTNLHTDRRNRTVKITIAGCGFERKFPEVFYTGVLYYVRFLQSNAINHSGSRNG